MLFADGTQYFKIFIELKKKSRKYLLIDDLVTPGVNILFHWVRRRIIQAKLPFKKCQNCVNNSSKYLLGAYAMPDTAREL